MSDFISGFDYLEDSVVHWEEVGGTFACQERGCVTHATEAKYLDSKNILTWECPEGHISKLTEYEL